WLLHIRGSAVHSRRCTRKVSHLLPPPLHRIGNRILVEQPSGGIQGNLYLLPL
ncbi:unnamed protein product, partial [Arabidopsis halleri]